MSTELRITPATSATAWGSDIDFNEEETLNIRVIPNSDCAVMPANQHKPRVYDESKSHAESDLTDKLIAEIKIRVKSTATQTKLDTLFGYGYKFKVYYEYGINAATLVVCILDPNKIETYIMGQAAVREVTLMFYETENLGDNNWDTSVKISPIAYIDVDNENIKLGDVHDISKISKVTSELILDPKKLGTIKLKNITVTFNDYDEFFAPTTLRGGYKPFRIWWYPIVSGASIGATSFEIDTMVDGNPPVAEKAVSGDKIIITDGDNSEKRVLTNVVTSGNNQILYFTTPLTNAYASGSMVSTVALVGQKFQLDIKKWYGGTYHSSFTIFKGYIREAFESIGNKAVLKIDSLLGKAVHGDLKINSLSANPTQRIGADGILASTISWTTQTGSGTLSAPTVYSGSQLGRFEITFSDDTNFTVTGPGVNAKAGTTGSNFYDQTDADDSQIQIPAANWGGAPAAGDVVEFYVSVNFDGIIPSTIALSLLEDYGGIDSADTVYFSVQYPSETIAVSFSHPGTIGQALSAVLPHTALGVGDRLDGKVILTRLEYRDSMAEVVPTTRQVRNRELSTGITDFYNEFIIHYAWDPVNETNQNTYIYPEQDSLNPSFKALGKKRSVEIYMPGYYAEADVATWAKRLYAQWCMGIMTYEQYLPSTWVSGIGSPLYQIHCLNPDILHNAFIYKHEFDLLKKAETKLSMYGFKNDILNRW